jgi:hypothetical protein
MGGITSTSQKRKAHQICQGAALGKPTPSRVITLPSPSIQWSHRESYHSSGKPGPSKGAPNHGKRAPDQYASLVRRRSIPSATSIKTISTAETMRRDRVARFDSSAFDSQLYAQEGALSPPSGVCIVGECDEQSLQQTLVPPFPHYKPRVHGMQHQRQAWNRCMAEANQTQPLRKAWLAKASERQQWSTNGRERAADEEHLFSRTAQRHARPGVTPWMHNVAIDFSDIAEDDLPEDVKHNSTWMSICAQFRKNKFHNKKLEKIYEQDWRETQAPSKKDEIDRSGNHEFSSSTQQPANTQTAHAKRLLRRAANTAILQKGSKEQFSQSSQKFRTILKLS